jgi:hypothetical protein
MTAMRVTEFDVINHGIDYPDYFQGCGVSFTGFDDVVTGYGSSEAEAFDDALEQLASCGRWDIDGIEERIVAEYGKPSKKLIPKRYGDEAGYYLSIRVK